MSNYNGLEIEPRITTAATNVRGSTNFSQFGFDKLDKEDMEETIQREYMLRMLLPKRIREKKHLRNILSGTASS